MRAVLPLLWLVSLAGCAVEPERKPAAAEKTAQVYFQAVAEQGMLHRTERCGDADLLERRAGSLRLFASVRATGADSVTIHLIFYAGGTALAAKHRQFRLFDHSGAEMVILRSHAQVRPYDVPVSVYRKENVRATWVTLEAAAPAHKASTLELTLPSGAVALNRQALEIAPIVFKRVERPGAGEPRAGC